MPTPQEPESARQPSEALTHPWSTRLIVRMLFVAGIVSLLGGGAGTYLAYAGLVRVWSVPGSPQDQRLVPLYLGAALAALLSGLFFWWLLILRPRRITLGRGAWAGVLSSLITHPLAWLFALGGPVLTGGTASWALPPAPSAVTVLEYAGGYALYSLILTGWFTALIGWLAGVGVALMMTLLEEIDRSAPNAA